MLSFLLLSTIVVVINAQTQAPRPTRLQLLQGGIRQQLPQICAAVTKKDCSKFTLTQLLASIGSNEKQLAEVSKAFTEADAFLNSAPTKTCTVNKDKLQMKYSLYNPKGKKTTVVIHPGFTARRVDVVFLAMAFAVQNRPVLVMDPRGAGETGLGPTAGPYTAELMARDLGDLIKCALRGKPFHLVGTSLGGKIALVYAATRPRKLRVLSTGGTSGTAATVVQADCTNEFATLGQANAIRQSQCLYGVQSTRTKALLVLALRVYTFLFPFPSGGGANQLPIATFQNFQGVGILEKIRNPTLVVHGTGDILVGPATGPRIVNAINANRRFKLATYEPITDDGHSFWSTDPQEYTADFTKYLKNLRKQIRVFRIQKRLRRQRRRYAREQEAEEDEYSESDEDGLQQFDMENMEEGWM